jgi:hypothetical protein
VRCFFSLFQEISMQLCIFFHRAPQAVARVVALTGALALASFGVAAQSAGSVRINTEPTLLASTATTPVPSVDYRSPFQDIPKGIETNVVDWKTSNATVGQFKRGHADVLKWEAEQSRSMPPAAGGKP